MSNIILDKDIIIDNISNKKIAIIGYGNQGRAQALNLKDSGLEVKVGLRKNSNSKQKVEKDQLHWMEIKDAVKWADLISIMLPDKIAPEVFKKYILNNLTYGDTLLFSHGYNIHYKLIIPPSDVNVIMVAPSAGGNIVRNEYKKNYGVPALIAVKQDKTGNALDIAKSYAQAIGSSRVCIFESTFQEETETDIFGEQAILTGGLPYLINTSYNTLVDNGYDSTVAWFVCYYEIKTIVDLFHEKGFKEFYKLISDTARYGGITRGEKLINNAFKNTLVSILNDIKSKKFNKELNNSDNLNTFPKSFEGLEKQTKKILNLINEKKNILIEDLCLKTGQKIIDIYDKKNNSKLIFPEKRKTNKDRVSEQEARFIFANEVVNSNYKYAVEVPTKNRYSNFSHDPKIHLTDGGGRSASIDMSLYNNNEELLINIEFKKGQPTQNRKTKAVPSITKDLLKLLFEKSQTGVGVFFHILEHTHSGTLDSFLTKFKRAANSEVIVSNIKDIECSQILLFIVILENSKDEEKHSRCLKCLIDFSSSPIKKIKLDG